jgi:glutathione synthase
MLHGPDSLETAIPLQVELNTIASSFGCLSSKLTQLHQHLQHLTQTNYELPDNGAAHGIAKGLAMALEEYHRQTRSSSTTTTTTTTTPAVVVMVVQPGETNSCDQRELEFLLLEHHGVRLIRRTLLDLATTTIEGNDAGGHALLLKGNNNNNDTKTETDDDEVVEVGVVYYRAGYTPNDYPTELEWMGRSKVEHSAAIKCPDVFYHIVGAKKVQQALAEPGALRLFCESDSEEEDEGLLSSCFAGLYALGEGEDPSTVPMALANPHSYVLKPQREGGGNNLYDDALVEALTTMTHTERGAYILMDKILPPSSPGSLVRGGTIVYNADCVCELGVFGVTLREYGTDRILMNEAVGHILRAKSVLTDEGGVAAGYAFLSSPKLV